MATHPTDHPADDDDPGFEVVHTPPARPRRAVPAKPVPTAPRTARPLPAKPVAAKPSGVVRKAAAVPAPSAIKPRVVEAAPPSGSPSRATVVIASDLADTAIDHTPQKKRLTAKDRKRIRKEMASERAEEWKQEKQEWTVPLILIGAGLVMMFGAAGYQAVESTTTAIASVVMLVACFAYVCLMVPLAVTLMMIVGKLFGIEYGSLKMALRTLGAFLTFLIGMYWASSAALGVYALFITPPIASIIGYVMFMKFFYLDVEDARTSTFIVNVITWFGNWLFRFMVITFLLVSADNGPDYDGGGVYDPVTGQYSGDDYNDDYDGYDEEYIDDDFGD